MTFCSTTKVTARNRVTPWALLRLDCRNPNDYHSMLMMWLMGRRNDQAFRKAAHCAQVHGVVMVTTSAPFNASSVGETRFAGAEGRRLGVVDH